MSVASRFTVVCGQCGDQTVEVYADIEQGAWLDCPACENKELLGGWPESDPT